MLELKKSDLFLKKFEFCSLFEKLKNSSPIKIHLESILSSHNFIIFLCSIDDSFPSSYISPRIIALSPSKIENDLIASSTLDGLALYASRTIVLPPIFMISDLLFFG